MSNRNAEFARRKHFNYKNSEKSAEKNEIKKINEVIAIEKAGILNPGQHKNNEREFEELTASLPDAKIKKNNPSATPIPAFVNGMGKRETGKFVRNVLTQKMRQSILGQENQKKPEIVISAPPPSDRMILEVIISVLLPPLAVFLHQGDITDYFWIDVLLTILFWFPGIIFALLVVLDVFG